MTSPRFVRAVVVGSCIAAAIAGVAAQTVLSRVGLSETDAKTVFMQSMIGFASPGAASRPFLALAPAARATVVTEAVAWAKTYAGSAAFKKTWAQRRDESKPEAPQSDADVQKQQATDQQKQLDDLKKTIASLPADQQKAMQAMVDQLMAQQAAQQKDPAYQALMKQSADATKAQAQKSYQDAVSAWQKEYPADPNVAIARRLRDFLTMSADVTFDAKLVTKGSNRTFADSTLEAKPDSWKVCYRAGREATTAARAAAQAWLKEIGQ